MSEGDYKVQPLPTRLADATRRRGARVVTGEFVRWAGRLAAGVPRARAGTRGEFTFEGRRHRYVNRIYKLTWMNERAVEVPIAQHAVDEHRGRRILEVGHVLGHYAPQSHVIVDKYEQAPGVRNLDVFDLAQLGEFDLVVAVSTVEHVGWDEQPRVPGLAVDAIRALQDRVAPGGRLLLTVPAGYNPSLDAALRAGEIPFTRTAGLRRQGGGTSWREVPAGDVWSAPYDFLMYAARGVLIATWDRPPAG